MRTLISAFLLASAVASAAVAKPVTGPASQSWGFQADQGLSAEGHARSQLRTYDQCFALAEARGFGITGSENSGAQRRDKFIRDCEAGTQS
jgi:hypothetical protein